MLVTASAERISNERAASAIAAPEGFEIMRRHGISSSVFYTWRKQAWTAVSTGFMPVQMLHRPLRRKDVGLSRWPVALACPRATACAARIRDQAQGVTLRRGANAKPRGSGPRFAVDAQFLLRPSSISAPSVCMRRLPSNH